MSKHLSDIAEIIMGQSPDGSSCGPNVLGMPLLNGPTEFGSHHPTTNTITKVLKQEVNIKKKV